MYVLILVINYFKEKFYNELRLRTKDTSDNNLATHPIFSRMNYLLNQTDYALEFDEGRSKLITDIINKQFKVARKHLLEFAKEVTKKELNNENINIHSLHMKYYNKLIREYTNPENYNVSDREQKILSIALLEFQKWHKQRSDLLRQMSADISQTRFYKHNVARGSAILNTHMGIMIDVLHDARDTLKDINGRLSGKVYKDIELE